MGADTGRETVIEAMPANNSKGIKTASVPGGVALESRSWSRCRPGDASSSTHQGEAPWFERTCCSPLAGQNPKRLMSALGFWRKKMNTSVDELRAVFSYCETTGEIRRNDLPSRRNCLATVADNPNRSRRLIVNYKKKAILAHRLAWALHTGDWPKGDIDHINGDESDNRLANLRDVSKSINQQNKRRPRTDNKVGLLGVSWHARGRKWRAQITVQGTRMYLGLFTTPDAAHAAYLEAKRMLHPGCTI